MKSADPIRNRRLRRLQLSLELDDFAGELILDLLDEMERMRRDLDRLRPLVDLERRRRSQEA